jgi:ABC-type sugar transport systems, permease components
MRRKRKLNERKEIAAAILFLLPNLLGFLCLTAIPVIASFALSFFDWKLLDKPAFVGIANFAELLKDDLFWKSTVNTAVFVFVKVPLSILFALLLAIVLNRKLIGRDLFRTIAFLPVICSSVSIALIWQPLFDQTSGLLNVIVCFFGGKPVPWLSSTKWAMPSVIGVAIWKEVGYAMVIFLAGLQGIPRTYYEAARVDGSNVFQEFWHITVPLISPTTFFVLVTSIIGAFQVFDLTTVLTQGGPGNATNTLVMYIYQSGFKNFRMGYASALAMMLFLIVLALTLIQNRSSKDWVQE